MNTFSSKAADNANRKDSARAKPAGLSPASRVGTSSPGRDLRNALPNTPSRSFAVLLLFALFGPPLFVAEQISRARAAALEADFTSPAGEIERFRPKSPRTVYERDRLEALSLFAVGRMKENQNDFPAALRWYQRALRLDPRSLPIVRQIVTLAFNLNRSEEAIRYALKAVELDPSNPQLLRRLGAQLTEKGDFPRALSLYEQAEQIAGKEKPSAAGLVIWTEMGRLYYLTGRPEKAADYFAKVISGLERANEFGLDEALLKTLFPELNKTYEAFGAAFLEAHRPDEAMTAFRKSNDLSPDRAVFAFRRAQVLNLRKEYASALEQLREYFEEHAAAKGTEPYQLLADLMEQLNQKQELIPRLEKLLAEDKDNAPLAYFLAVHHQAEKHFDAAEPIFRRLLEKKVTLEACRALLEIYQQTDRPKELLGVLTAAANKTTDLDDLGKPYQELLKDEKLVERVLDAAEQTAEGEDQAIVAARKLAAALTALKAKRYPRAEKFFNAVVESEKKRRAEVYLAWGAGLLADEQYRQAADVFRRAVREQALPSDNPAFYYYLAGALEMSGDTDEALKVARQGIALGGDRLPQLHGRVPWILFHAGRYDDAIREYQSLIEKFGSTYDNEAVRALVRDARLSLSNIFVLQKKMDEAEESLQQVLDENPDDPGALNDLGYIWADRGKNLERAWDMIRRAVSAEPDNESYRDSLGWVLYKLEKYPEALEEMKKAASTPAPDPVILEHLGEVYLKLGQKEEARRAFQRALEGFTKSDDQDKIKEMTSKIDKLRQTD